MPLPGFEYMKTMEDKILSLNKENLKVYVICSGLWYGQGEILFKNYFKAAWMQEPEALPYLGNGTNMLPTINVRDLVKFIIKISENPPENDRYFM